MSQDPNLRQAAALTNTVGQIGCVTGIVALVIIGVAFGAGWLLDDFLGNERKIFTVIFMLGSFPVTLWAMIRLSLWMIGKAIEVRLDGPDPITEPVVLGGLPESFEHRGGPVEGDELRVGEPAPWGRDAGSAG